MIVIEGKKSFFLATSASLIDESKDTASEWASKHIHSNPAYKWVLGNYVQADKANSNGQFWTFESLKASQESIQNSPINFLHRPRHILGTFTASEMLYPTEEAADGEEAHPFVEALGVLWKYYFPNEMMAIEAAFNAGALAFSMECIGETITCTGPNGCGQEFAYAGPVSKSYCEHVNKRQSTKQINNPHFLGGALIIPPHRPGWGGASVNELASLTQFHDDAIHDIYEQLKKEMPHFNELELEAATSGFLTAVSNTEEPDESEEQTETISEEEAENSPEETKKNPVRLAREVLAERFSSAH